MRLQYLLPKEARAGIYQRLRGFSSRLAGKLYLSLWFPHVPLAIAVGFSGILQLIPAVEYIVELELPRTEDFREIPREAIRLMLEWLPRGLVGLMLLTMAVGFLGRSRLAWIITLILTAATVLTQWRHQATSTYTFYNSVLLFLLILSYRHFDRSSLTAGTLFAIISLAFLLGYVVIGSYLIGEGFSPPIEDLVAAFYFAIVSMSTVGYGDIVPVTPEARLFVMSTILLGITVFATSISAIIVPIVSNRVQRLVQPQGKKMERKNHYIIIGGTFLAYNTYKELHKRNLPVTLVLSHPPEAIEFPEADILVGDLGNLDILNQAGVECSQAVLALGKSDSDNAFLVLAVKEFGGSAKTVVAVNNARNLGRVRRVQPDLIIAPEVLGGELLAMALSGENPDSETLIGRLLYQP